MKCTSCVSAARPKSDDEEAAVSPSPTMDKEEYRVESPPPLPERSSRIPSVSIVELPADFQRGSPAPSGNSQLLRPLDVITEETSDVSDSENRPPPPDLCFPRPKPRYKKPKSKNLLKNMLRQEPTTCVLVDAKIAEAAPEEYRSVCTTETVPEQMLEVEVIDLGSNSSSLADLTDIDDLDPDKVNNNEEPPQPIDSPKHPDDNDNDNESIAAPLSEEDNNGYSDGSCTQTHDDACTQNDDDGEADDHHEENDDRTESDRDDEEAAITERSLAAGVDRVVTRNVTEVKDRDDDRDGSSSDCCSEELQEVTHPAAIGESLVTVTEDGCDSMGEEEAPPEVPPRPPPPPAATMRQTVEPPTAVAVTNLGQDEVHEGCRPHDAQVPAGGDTGEADPADADQSGEEDSGDAVVVPSDSSVLLKLLQDPVVEAVEKRPTSAVPDQISRAENCVGAPPAGTKIERAVKSEQLNYEIVQDHRVLREETTVTNSSSASSEVILRRRPSTNDRNESPKEPSPEQKAALVHDLRNEISRIKDAELQEEFRKLELEAARIEQDLNNMAVVPPSAENLTYYVSKQNDFAVERPPPAALPRQKPPAPTPPTPPPKPTQPIPSSPSSNDLMYNEWQAKMEEREARRLHKVVKLASKPDPSEPPSEDPALGDEFLRKVKDRRRKFTIPGDSDPDTDTGSAPGTPIAGRKPVPKHIEQEFAEFAKLRKQQQQEQEADEKPGESPLEQAKDARSPPPPDRAKDGTVGQRPPSLLVLASAIGIVVWTVCRVLFGRE